MPLARRAVERVTDGMLHIDDSSGIIGHDLRELTGLYARACASAPPDPAKLAEWLVASRCDDGLRDRQRRKYSFTAKLDAAFGAEGSPG